MGGHGYGFGYPLGGASRQGGASWSPGGLTGIFYWGDLAQAVETDAFGITQMTDISGQANHLLQNVDVKKCTLSTFEGYLAAEEAQAEAGFHLSGSEVFTGAMTWAWAHYSTKNSCFYCLDTGGIRDRVGGMFNAITASGNLDISVVGAVVPNKWQITVIRRDDSDQWTVRQTGVDKTAPGTPTLGGDMRVRTIPRESSTSNVQMNSLVITKSFVTGDDLTELESYLASRVGL